MLLRVRHRFATRSELSVEVLGRNRVAGFEPELGLQFFEFMVKAKEFGV